jgi:hypothetical protein
VITVPEQARALVSAVTNSVGEAVYVCAVPSDTFGWLTAQLAQPRDALVGALAVAETFLFTLPLAIEDATRPAWHLNSFEPDDRLSDVMQRSLIMTPSGMTGVTVH